jgi:hypothetical protein
MRTRQEKLARISKCYYTKSNNKRRHHQAACSGRKIREKKIGNSLQSASNLNCADNSKKKYFDYFVFNIVDYIRVDSGLPRSGARRRALAQTIGNARGLDINSPQSA